MGPIVAFLVDHGQFEPGRRLIQSASFSREHSRETRLSEAPLALVQEGLDRITPL
jgi:hypothetical protein